MTAEPLPHVDLRLVPAALAAWLTTIAALAAPPPFGFVAGSLAVLLAGVLLAITRTAHPTHAPLPSSTTPPAGAPGGRDLPLAGGGSEPATTCGAVHCDRPCPEVAGDGSLGDRSRAEPAGCPDTPVVTGCGSEPAATVAAASGAQPRGVVVGGRGLPVVDGADAESVTSRVAPGHRPRAGAVGGGRAWTARWLVPAALALGFAGVAALGVAIRVQARDASPLARLAADSAAVTLDVAVADDPRPLAVRGTGGPAGVLVRARAQRVAAAGRAWTVSGEVIVLAPAEGWRDLLPSQRLSLDGRLSPPRGGDLTAAVVSVRVPPRLLGEPSWAHRAAGGLRAGLRDAAAVLPDGASGLLPGLVVGDTSRMDPVLAEHFRTTGLSHLTAVSGMNLTIVAGAVLLLLRALTAGPRISAAGAGLALVGFVVLARPSPSVLRAGAMAAIALVALAVGRGRSAMPALAATVLALVLAAPGLARSPGFALSVVATAALLLLVPAWSRRLRRRGVPRGVAEAVAIPAGAHLVTAPLIAAISGTLSLVAVPANLLAAPAVAPATVLGVLVAVTSPISTAVAEMLARLAGLPVGWLVLVAERGARVPAAAVHWPAGVRGGLELAGALALGVALVRIRGFRRTALAGVVGAALVMVPARLVLPAWPPSGWVFVACDVGQGDALAVNAGPDTAVVIDAGPDPTAVDSCLRGLGVTRVPLLVLTHLHADHVGGLDGVLRGRAVGAVEVGPLREPAWAWRAIVAAAERRRLPLLTSAAGEVRELAGVRLEVVAPRTSLRGTRSDPNNSSVVLRVRAAGHTILLTGDVEVEGQEAIVGTGADLRADVLKVPHHGSAWQSPEFLARVRPALAVVSVGAGNDYGHPSSRLLAELTRLGARTVRTDRDGDVAVSATGGRLAVTTHQHPP